MDQSRELDYMERACLHLGVGAEQVLKWTIRGPNVVVILDLGIKGCPKHIVPLATLDQVDDEALAEFSALLPWNVPSTEPVLAQVDPVPEPILDDERALDYLEWACAHLGLDDEKILKWGIRGGDIFVILDMGIKGCPKYVVPLTSLDDKRAAAEAELDALLAVAGDTLTDEERLVLSNLGDQGEIEHAEDSSDAPEIKPDLTLLTEEDLVPANLDEPELSPELAALLDEPTEPELAYVEFTNHTPAALELAQAQDPPLQLALIKGSGSGGRVTKRDVERVLEAGGV